MDTKSKEYKKFKKGMRKIRSYDDFEKLISKFPNLFTEQELTEFKEGVAVELSIANQNKPKWIKNEIKQLTKLGISKVKSGFS